ncbi:MAG: hypothetical protein WCV85_01950 [Patescibacteria group bacterium]|jgi:hypothetical protein
MGGEGETGYVPENEDVKAGGYMTAKRAVEQIVNADQSINMKPFQYDAENVQARLIEMVNHDLADKGRGELDQDSQDAMGNAVSAALEDGKLNVETLQAKVAEVVSAHLEKAGGAE